MNGASHANPIVSCMDPILPSRFARPMNARGALVPPDEVAREVVRLVEDGSVTGQAIVVE